MEKKDIVIVCNSCNTEFLFTVGEQEFYGKLNFLEPKKCKQCRDARKVNRYQKD